MQLKDAGKVAIWSSVGGLAFILLLYVLILPVSLATLLSSAALVTAGGGVVGGLLAVSMAEEDH